MSLRLITVQGHLALGDAPPTHEACVFCGNPAQVVAEGASGDVTACAGCTQDAIVTAALLADTPGGAPINDETCARIQAWTEQRRATGHLSQAIVDRRRPVGHPLLGTDAVRLHPEDMGALQRWADRQPPRG